MIRSMTGFGKGEAGGFVMEMRSVNHKYLDLSLKLPRDLYPLEGRLKKAVSEKFSRGRIDIYITRGGQEEVLRALRLNSSLVKQYIELFSELKDTYGLRGEVDLNLLASFKDIVSETEEAADIEEVWAVLEKALDDAMASLDSMRAQEGLALAADIKGRAALIAANLDMVEKKAPTVVTEYQAKLKERVGRLAAGIELDADRLLQEVAFYAERCDITEEIVRARSHIAQFGRFFEGGPVGRKMEFLVQEINREVNTIGSKASDQEIAHRVVDMKSELEKIREQIQNIE